jgi:phosphinothricin acetyltransferase
MIRIAEAKDAALIAIIYNHYIANSTVTFEEEAVDSQMILKRMNANKQLKWWVCEIENEIVGYAYASLLEVENCLPIYFGNQCLYRFRSSEEGNWEKDYSHLIEELKTLGFKTLLAGISLPNKGSVLFHENLGFRKVGQLERVGFKFNKWIDVGYWELNL